MDAQQDQQSDKYPGVQKPAPSAPTSVRGCKKKKHIQYQRKEQADHPYGLFHFGG